MTGCDVNKSFIFKTTGQLKFGLQATRAFRFTHRHIVDNASHKRNEL